MLPRIDLPRALLRGRYMAAAAAMEHNGTPIDVETLARLREGWTGIQDDLIRAIDVYGVYDGRTFKSERWAKLMAALGIPWPMLESGQLDLSDDTFRQMAKSHPVVSPYRELRSCVVRPAPQRSGSREAMGVIAQYCQRSDRARGAINLAILDLYLAPASGCAG